MPAKPMVARPFREFGPALTDALVTRPCYLVQVELYLEHLILRQAESGLRVFIRRQRERFDYDGSCVHCEMLRILHQAEVYGAPGSAGVTHSYRERLKAPSKFVAVFRPRHPQLWWNWGWDAAALVVPRGLCAEHRPGAAA